MIFDLPTFAWQAGETKRFYVAPRRDSGTYVDLSGATAKVAVVNAVNPTSTPLLKKECGSTTLGDINYVLIDITPEDTADFPSGCYIYILTITDTEGRKERFAGHWHLLEDYDKDE